MKYHPDRSLQNSKFIDQNLIQIIIQMHHQKNLKKSLLLTTFKTMNIRKKFMIVIDKEGIGAKDNNSFI